MTTAEEAHLDIDMNIFEDPFSLMQTKPLKSKA